jgi:hypothetical protein
VEKHWEFWLGVASLYVVELVDGKASVVRLNEEVGHDG